MGERQQDNTAGFPAAAKLAGEGQGISPDLEAAKQADGELVQKRRRNQFLLLHLTLFILVHPKSVFLRLQCHTESLHLEQQDHL